MLCHRALALPARRNVKSGFSVINIIPDANLGKRESGTRYKVLSINEAKILNS